MGTNIKKFGEATVIEAKGNLVFLKSDTEEAVVFSSDEAWELREWLKSLILQDPELEKLIAQEEEIERRAAQDAMETQ